MGKKSKEQSVFEIYDLLSVGVDSREIVKRTRHSAGTVAAVKANMTRGAYAKKKASKKDIDRALKLLKNGSSSSDVAKKTGLSKFSVAAIKAHRTMGTYS